MKRSTPPHIITAIDVGTTKICVLIAQPTADGSLHIIGMGQAPSAGLARGVVVTMAPAVQAIQAAVREAELMAGFSISNASVGISGAHIRAFSSHGMVAIKQGEIKDRDIQNVIHAAQAVALPDGQQLLHAVPQYFIINGVDMVHNPRGMFGVRLEARVHIITGAIASAQNLIRCCELAGIKVDDLVLEPIASAEAVLSADERELGVGILDIGGGTADFALYQKGAIGHTAIIPLAGNVFTNDIAVCLRTSLQDAERIKRLYGLADPQLLTSNQPIDIARTDGSEQATILTSELLAVLSARTEELLLLVGTEIERHALRKFMHAGLVITGGGALLAGLKEQAARLLRMPVRIGRPIISNNTLPLLENPIYATGYGLLAYTHKQRRAHALSEMHGPLLNRLMGKMKSWVFDIF